MVDEAVPSSSFIFVVPCALRQCWGRKKNKLLVNQVGGQLRRLAALLQTGTKGKAEEKAKEKVQEKGQTTKAGPVDTAKESPAKKRKAPAADGGAQKPGAAASGKKKAKGAR